MCHPLPLLRNQIPSCRVMNPTGWLDNVGYRASGSDRYTLRLTEQTVDRQLTRAPQLTGVRRCNHCTCRASPRQGPTHSAITELAGSLFRNLGVSRLQGPEGESLAMGRGRFGRSIIHSFRESTAQLSKESLPGNQHDLIIPIDWNIACRSPAP